MITLSLFLGVIVLSYLLPLLAASLVLCARVGYWIIGIALFLSRRLLGLPDITWADVEELKRSKGLL